MSSDEEEDIERQLEQIQQNTCKYNLSCHLCAKTFSSKRSLLIHLRIHNNVAPYVCHVCFKKYASNASLRSHFLTHQEIKRSSCPKCDAVTYPGSLLKHSCTRLKDDERYIFRDGKFQCRKCSAMFDSKAQFCEHRKTHTEGFTCDLCEKQFFKKRIFQNHMKVHKEGYQEKVISCGECKKVFSSEKSLKKHFKVTHEGKRFPCHVCQKQFRHRKSLQDHLNKHAKVSSYQCQTCSATFVYQSSFVNHKKLHEPQGFRCCDREFISRDQLESHRQRTHLKERKYKCKLCEKAYLQKSHLDQHLKSHGDSNYICELCATEFLHKNSYKHHMKLHYVGKQFKCDECQKAFATKYELKKHIERHQREYVDVVGE